ncbi:MAG: Rpn family recombination-promoting nuclease/putative transposase, partial [Planctomycetaceae bacterium]|nr:Rpn family recombination-promoting nuclease/putative transposase [Planctomycetaceae bacterium]
MPKKTSPNNSSKKSLETSPKVSAKTSAVESSMLTQPFNFVALEEFKKKYQHDAFCKEKLRNVRMARKFLRYFLKPEYQEWLDIDHLQIEPDSLVDKH